MNVLNLRQSIDRFLEQLASSQAFLEGLKELAGYSEQTAVYVERISQPDGRLMNEGAAQLNGHFTKLFHITANISNRYFFQALESFQSALKTLQMDWRVSENPFESLHQCIEKFAEIYDTYLAQRNGPSARNLLAAAQKLNNQIHIFIERRIQM